MFCYKSYQFIKFKSPELIAAFHVSYLKLILKYISLKNAEKKEKK
jgi:hypothetical protein